MIFEKMREFLMRKIIYEPVIPWGSGLGWVDEQIEEWKKQKGRKDER